jgi:hypothetical protein
VSREPYRHNADRHNPRHDVVPAAWDAIRPTGIARDCFADEIAIDFPSVGHAVERIRAAFLEERPAADVLATELQLSSVEARRGLVVPLTVPMRGTCSRCGGRGETWTEPCDPCCGTGESLFHHAVRVSVPAGVAHGTRLRFRVTSPHAPAVRVELRVAIRSSAA